MIAIAADCWAPAIVIDAEGEARVLLEVAAHLGEAPVAAAADLDPDDQITVDVRDDAVLDLGRPDTVLSSDPAAP